MCSNYTVIYRTTELVSGIVSTGLQCEDELCPTENLELESPILITIQHSDSVKVCVHYILSIPVLIVDDILNAGAVDIR